MVNTNYEKIGLSKGIYSLGCHTINDKGKEFLAKYGQLKAREAVHKFFTDGQDLFGLCSYGFVKDDDYVELTTSSPCHAGMGYHSIDKKFSDFYTSCYPKKQNRTPAAKAYLEFCCDKDKSPWKNVLQGEVQSSLYTDDKDMPQALHIYGDVDSLQKFTLHSLSVAIRMAYEYPTKVNEWYHAVTNLGMTEVEALYWMIAFRTTQQGQISIQPGMGHWPFDSVTFKEIAFDWLKEGTPNNPEDITVGKHRSYAGVNAIWNKTVNPDPLITKAILGYRDTVSSSKSMFAGSLAKSAPAHALDLTKTYECNKVAESFKVCVRG